MHYRLMTYHGCFALLGYPVLCVFECTKTRDVADTPISAGARVLINRRKKRKWRRGRRGFDFFKCKYKRSLFGHVLVPLWTVHYYADWSRIYFLLRAGVFVKNGWRYSVNQNVNFAFILFCFCCFLEWRVCLTSQLILYCSVTTIYCH